MVFHIPSRSGGCLNQSQRERPEFVGVEVVDGRMKVVAVRHCLYDTPEGAVGRHFVDLISDVSLLSRRATTLERLDH